MKCESCNSAIKDADSFCPNCGKQTEYSPEKVEAYKPLFYAKNCLRTKVSAIVTLPKFDILMDKNYLYVINPQPYQKFAGIGFIIGLIAFGLISGAIGYLIGERIDNKFRNKLRSFWINDDGEIFSLGYEPYLYTKLPISKIKESTNFKKRVFNLNTKDGKIYLKLTKDKAMELNNVIKEYVL